MKITNAMIGMSVASGSAKNLFWMDDSGVEIGSLSTSTTSGLKAVNVNDGSYALIKRTDGIEFGTKNSYGASIVSMRSQRVLIATRTGATKTLSSTEYILSIVLLYISSINLLSPILLGYFCKYNL